MFEFNKTQIFYLIGIGGFILATFFGFTSLVQMALRDFQIWNNQKPILNYWITECALFVVYVLLAILVLRKIKTLKNFLESKLQKMFFVWLFAFIISQILQFLYAIYCTDFVLKNRLDEFSNYTDFFRKEYLLQFYQSLFVILRYLIFALLIFVAGKSVKNNLYR